MKPAEKIELLKSLSSGLASLDSEEIDLIFRQFGLPTSDDRDGNPKAYCIDHLEQHKKALKVSV